MVLDSWPRRLCATIYAVVAALVLSATTALAAEPAIKTSSEIFAPQVPITILFSGLPGNKLDLVVVVPKSAPPGGPYSRFGYLKGQVEGSIQLGGLPQGQYEVRLMVNNSPQIVASYPFSVGEIPKATETKDVPEPRPAGDATSTAQSPSSTKIGQSSESQALPEASTEPSSANLRTSKRVYAENEPIQVMYEGATGHNQDSIAILRFGEESRKSSEQTLRGVTSGSVEFKGLREGTYEAILYRGESYQARLYGGAYRDENEILASQVFTVGQNCLKPSNDEDKICDLSIWPARTEFSTNEPITIFFEGGPGNGPDWITLVKIRSNGEYEPPPGNNIAFAPDGEHKPFFSLNGQMKGSFLFAGLPDGEYEAQFYIWRTETPAARATLTVTSEAEIQVVSIGDGAGDAAGTDALRAQHRLPDPGLVGSWLGEFHCVRKLGSRELLHLVPAFMTISSAEPPEAEFYVMPTTTQGFALRLSGEFDSGTGKLSLQPAEWISQPTGNEWTISIEANLDSTGLMLRGTPKGAEDCSAFEAVKFLRDERPPRNKGLIRAWESYGQTLVSESTCKRFMSWVTGGKLVKSQGREIPSQVLNGDGFYSAIGKPYDRWNFDDRRVYATFHNGCLVVLSKSKDIKLAALAREAKSATAVGLSAFLASAMPPQDRGATASGATFDFLKNYALVIALKNARLYAKLQLDEAGKLSDSRQNWGSLVQDIAAIEAGKGVLKALTEEEKREQIAALTTLKETMSGVLVEKQFAEFQIDNYSRDLEGLKRARRDETAMKDDARTYVTPLQFDELDRKFTAAFVPLSVAVADQAINSMSTISGTPAGFMEGKLEKDAIEADVVPYLNDTEKPRTIESYERRNIAAINQFLPTFPDWLEANISPDHSGKNALEDMVRIMFDSKLDSLDQRRLGSPYEEVASAILSRNEKLKFQICDLPSGFEELRSVICLEAIALASGNQDTHGW